ncbi:MAG: hypothetical protein IT514_00410, partial [Burkholderiales bacterium]|nr:hypothetical protein [Burkholderiales bacterium]
MASSPAAAEKALTTRLAGTREDLEALADEDRVLDGTPDELVPTDIEPAAQLEDAERLAALIDEARALAGDSGDPKLATLIQHLRGLLDAGFRPVVFCRYVATAHYVAEHLRKHRPEDEGRINQALIKAALLKRERVGSAYQQGRFDFGDEPIALQPLELRWRDALEKARANRTVFAQRRLRPDEVLPEWQCQRSVPGDADDVQRFVAGACARLNAPLEPRARHGWRLLPQHLPQTLRERLADEGIGKPLAIDFHYPPAVGTRFVHRSHPLVGL